MGEIQKTDELASIPEIETELRELAESAAGALLKCGGRIPGKVGIHVREIDWWYRSNTSRYINAYYHLSACRYLRSLDAANSTARDFYSLGRLEYLESLKVGRYKTYNSKNGQGPTNEDIRKHWFGIGCYDIKHNPLYRRFGKKREKPLPSMTDIDWISKLKRLKDLSIEVHGVSKLSPLSDLKNLEILKLHGANTPSLHIIRQLTRLKEIELYNCAIEDLSLLEKFPSLTKLHIERCEIGLLSSLPESLMYSRIQRNRINDVVLEGNLPNISELHFLNNEVTGKTIGLDEHI